MSQYHQDHDALQDVQNRSDERGVVINKVGIREIRYPIEVQISKTERQKTIGNFSLSVKLPADKKGTHMSRMVEILNTYQVYNADHAEEIMRFMSERLNATEAHILVDFSFFIERKAPETEKTSVMEYGGRYELHYEHGKTDFRSGVKVYVTSLCPCSKEISDYGAHSQRSEVKIDIHPRKGERIGLLELVEAAEQSASSPLYPLLKREDERHVTMRAYDNPVFVEDLSRNVAKKLTKMSDRLDKARIEVTNFESIHRHDAFAEIELEF